MKSGEQQTKHTKRDELHTAATGQKETAQPSQYFETPTKEDLAGLSSQRPWNAPECGFCFDAKAHDLQSEHQDLQHSEELETLLLGLPTNHPNQWLLPETLPRSPFVGMV